MEKILIIIFCLSLVSCSQNEFQVRSVKQIQGSKNKILFGPISNRDYKTPKAFVNDFRDLLAFELIRSGYQLISEIDSTASIQSVQNTKNSKEFDYYLVGVVSIHSNERLIDKKDSLFIFLHLYDFEGHLVGLVNSSFDTISPIHPERNRFLANQLIHSLDQVIQK